MRCINCGGDNADDVRFCPQCGAPAAPPVRATAEVTGERRQITVMFVDLVGSTELSAEMDPEELAELVLSYQERGRDDVERFGGHVAQFLGDGLLSYFGFPIAHEDDAERAVRAGLAILGDLDQNTVAIANGVRLHARVGVHTGPVVVGEMGRAGRVDTSAFGQTPNIAARLEGIARPGTVVVSDIVRRLVGDRIELRDLGMHTLKGVSSPVPAWEVVAVRDAGRSRPSLGRLIGRKAELAALHRCWTAARLGDNQLVLVSGEPGIGKTALARELQSLVRDRGDTWIELGCSPFGSATALRPLIELIGRELDGVEGPVAKLSRLRVLARTLWRRDPEAVELIAALLGIPSTAGYDQPVGDPELLRRRTMETIAEGLICGSEGDSLVVLVEDVHWSDPSTLEVVWLLFERAANVPILCLLTHRPGFRPRVPEGMTPVEIALERLHPDEATALASAVARRIGVDAEVAARLADYGDGVPLFIEELLYNASETESDVVSIPPSLESLLLARLDRLGPAKAVAQAAAAIGRIFPRNLLARVTESSEPELDEALDRLQTAGLVSSLDTPSWPAFVFRHALIQDAAVASMLVRSRRSLHGRIADLLRAGSEAPDAAEPGVIAQHLEEAGRPLEAAIWFSKAGERAVRTAALGEALLHFDRGLAVLGDAPEDFARDRAELTLQIQSANTIMAAKGMGLAELEAVWHRAVELGERLGDDEPVTSALNGLAVLYLDRGDYPVAINFAEQILDIGTRADLRIARVRANTTLGLAYFFVGDGRRALLYLERAVAEIDLADYVETEGGYLHKNATAVASYAMSATVCCWLGLPDRALVEAETALDMAERLSSAVGAIFARFGLADVHLLRGEPELALESARAGLAIADELRYPFGQGVTQLFAGAALVHLKDPTGPEVIEKALSILVDNGTQSGSGRGFCILAESQLLSGRREDAAETAKLGLTVTRESGQLAFDSELLRLQAAATTDRSSAEELLREAVSVSARQGAVLFRLRSCTDLAELLSNIGRDREATAILEGALRSWEDQPLIAVHRRARELAAQIMSHSR